MIVLAFAIFVGKPTGLHTGLPARIDRLCQDQRLQVAQNQKLPELSLCLGSVNAGGRDFSYMPAAEVADRETGFREEFCRSITA